LGLAGEIGQARDKAIEGLREERKKPDLKTKLPTQKTNCNYYSSVASKLPWKRSEIKLTALTRPNRTQGGASGVGMTDAVKLAHR